MKTAIYSRKSTLKIGQQNTIENQIKICRRRADELGLEIVDIKTDAATGTDDNNRPEVKELIRDAVKGNYECVIMKGISRLYRKTSKGLELIERLDQNGIRVITVEEHFDSHASENRTGTGKLDLSRLTMYLMFAEMESKKLGDRIKFTQIEKAHQGEWNQASSVPFGYSYNKTTKKLEVDFSNAEIVKLMFKLYLQGTGMNLIAQYLNGDNEEKTVYPSPKGKRWSEYTVGFLLKNQVYCGDIVYNRRSKTERPYKQPENIGKSEDDIYIGNDYNDKDKWIITQDAHEPIIDRETFAEVQSIMGTKAKRKGIRNNVSLLAGVGKCGKCGSGLTFKRGRKNHLGHVVTKDNYYCMNYIRYGKQFCTSHHAGAADLENIVIVELIEEISKRINSSKVKSGINTKKASTTEKDINKVESNIATLVHKMDVLLDKNIEGKVTDTQYSMFNEKYSKELDVLTKQLEKLKIKHSDQSVNDNQKEKVSKVYDRALNIREYPIEQQRYVILDLVNKVELNDGEISFEFNF
jgi:site-specific DNA recombinase